MPQTVHWQGWWVRDMNQQCYTGTHARVWLPIGIVALIVICIGIPLSTFLTTFLRR